MTPMRAPGKKEEGLALSFEKQKDEYYGRNNETSGNELNRVYAAVEKDFIARKSAAPNEGNENNCDIRQNHIAFLTVHKVPF